MRTCLIVDDHPLFREALAATVRSAFPRTAVVEAAALSAAMARLEAAAEGMDLLLLDLSLPGVRGFEGLQALRGRFPDLPILVVSSFDSDKVVHEALAHKANGFVSKAAGREDLCAAISRVLAGDVAVPASYADSKGAFETAETALAARLADLTPQQLRVLAKVRQGKLNKQIAYELGVGEQTVKAHVSEILHKLNVASRTQLVIETASVTDGMLPGDET